MAEVAATVSISAEELADLRKAAELAGQLTQEVAKLRQQLAAKDKRLAEAKAAHKRANPLCPTDLFGFRAATLPAGPACTPGSSTETEGASSTGPTNATATADGIADKGPVPGGSTGCQATEGMACTTSLDIVPSCDLILAQVAPEPAQGKPLVAACAEQDAELSRAHDASPSQAEGRLPSFSGYQLHVCQHAVAGWIEQHSPSCGAASLAGAWNAIRPPGKPTMDLIGALQLYRERFAADITKAQAALHSCLGAQDCDALEAEILRLWPMTEETPKPTKAAVKRLLRKVLKVHNTVTSASSSASAAPTAADQDVASDASCDTQQACLQSTQLHNGDHTAGTTSQLKHTFDSDANRDGSNSHHACAVGNAEVADVGNGGNTCQEAPEQPQQQPIIIEVDSNRGGLRKTPSLQQAALKRFGSRSRGMKGHHTSAADAPGSGTTDSAGSQVADHATQATTACCSQGPLCMPAPQNGSSDRAGAEQQPIDQIASCQQQQAPAHHTTEQVQTPSETNPEPLGGSVQPKGSPQPSEALADQLGSTLTFGSSAPFDSRPMQQASSHIDPQLIAAAEQALAGGKGSDKLLTVICNLLTKRLALWKLSKVKPSTAPIGNLHLMAALQALAARESVHLAIWKVLAAGKQRSQLHVRSSDSPEDIAEQWQGLMAVFQRPATVLLFHLENHYCLVFSAREWRMNVGYSGNRTVRQLLIARPGQRPGSWMDFETVRSTVLGWAGYAIIGISRQDDVVP